AFFSPIVGAIYQMIFRLIVLGPMLKHGNADDIEELRIKIILEPLVLPGNFFRSSIAYWPDPASKSVLRVLLPSDTPAQVLARISQTYNGLCVKHLASLSKRAANQLANRGHSL